jgi:hypothetical protein
MDGHVGHDARQLPPANDGSAEVYVDLLITKIG